MKRLGDVMQSDPGAVVNRGNARALRDVSRRDTDMQYLTSRTGGDAGMYVHREELHAAGAMEKTNWEGKRVIVFPLCWMDGVPVYPPVEIEPGEKRREAEAAINARYAEYRRNKSRQVSVSRSERYERG
jgi:hypothetical protein